MLRPASNLSQFLRGPWLPALVGGLCFLNSLPNDFVYDDCAIVLNNPRIFSLWNGKNVWLSDWWQPQSQEEREFPAMRRDRLYRPLALFSFAVNYAVGGLNPIGYHAVNIGLHVLVCFLVWRFAQRLFGDEAFSSCAALLFAVHPIHCEAVANVVGRAEVLAALFLLLGLLVLLPRTGRAGLGRALMAALLFFAALMAKETAVCYVPVALLALHAVQSTAAARPPRSWWLPHLGILLLPLVIYLPLRYVALDHHLLRDLEPSVIFNPLVAAEGWERWLAPFTILGHYTRLLLAPAQLSFDYGLRTIDPEAGPNFMTLLGALTFIGLCLALWGYRRPAGTLWRRLAVLAAMSWASYALISNTVLLIGVSLAERLMYWPSVPFLLFIAAAALGLWRAACAPGKALHNSARLLRVSGVALLAVLALRSVVRNFDWSENMVLFTADAATYPRGVHLNTAAASEFIDRASHTPNEQAGRQDLAEAEKHLQAALRLYARNTDALGMLGQLYALRGDRANALRYLDGALQLDASHFRYKKFYARLRDDTGRTTEQITALQERARQNPNDAAARLELGRLLLEAGRHPEAMRELKLAVQLAPENTDALYSLGEALAVVEANEEAVRCFLEVVSRLPDHWQAHANLTVLLAPTDPAASLRHAQEALRLKPDEYRNHQNLAEALAANGKIAEALKQYQRIWQGLSPGDPLRTAVEDRVRELERRQR